MRYLSIQEYVIFMSLFLFGQDSHPIRRYKTIRKGEIRNEVVGGTGYFFPMIRKIEEELVTIFVRLSIA